MCGLARFEVESVSSPAARGAPCHGVTLESRADRRGERSPSPAWCLAASRARRSSRARGVQPSRRRFSATQSRVGPGVARSPGGGTHRPSSGAPADPAGRSFGIASSSTRGGTLCAGGLAAVAVAAPSRLRPAGSAPVSWSPSSAGRPAIVVPDGPGTVPESGTGARSGSVSSTSLCPCARYLRPSPAPTH